jgi:hypothetical protein
MKNISSIARLRSAAIVLSVAGAAMALAACFGEVSAAKLPLIKGGVNTEKVEALLDTVAQTFQPYLALDDVPGYVVSNALNAFITAPRHAGRVYGSNTNLYDVPAVTQVLCTGNNVNLERDMMHRMLICELWLTQDADAIRHDVEMTPRWLASEVNRRRLLGSLWAMVRTWAEKGAAPGPWVKPRAAEWSRVVGGILGAAWTASHLAGGARRLHQAVVHPEGGHRAVVE